MVKRKAGEEVCRAGPTKIKSLVGRFIHKVWRGKTLFKDMIFTADMSWEHGLRLRVEVEDYIDIRGKPKTASLSP